MYVTGLHTVQIGKYLSKIPKSFKLDKAVDRVGLLGSQRIF